MLRGELSFSPLGVAFHSSASRRGPAPPQQSWNRPPKILQVMPPGKHFGPQSATSIDLDTRDFVLFSRYRDTTVVVADEVDPAFDSLDISYFPRCSRDRKNTAVAHIARVASNFEADVIVVQQRLHLAAKVAQAVPDRRVILHTHNFQKNFDTHSLLARPLRRSFRRRRYQTLHGIIHVSQACALAFAHQWPELQIPTGVISNGLDFAEWHPHPEPAREVLCVARFTPEKGVLEAAMALARVLREFPGWHARFILSEVHRHPRYWCEFNRAISGLGSRISVETDRPFAEVKQACERAAVALVPSKWVEPFGRTALEAHAGSAALISSGSGGLSEISGETALMLPEVSCDAIEASLTSLLRDDTLRARLAQAGALRARQLYDIRNQAAAMDQFLEWIASPNAQSAVNG